MAGEIEDLETDEPAEAFEHLLEMVLVEGEEGVVEKEGNGLGIKDAFQ